MISAWQVYLVMQMDNFISAFVVISLLSVLAIIFIFFAFEDVHPNEAAKIIKMIKILACVGILSSIPPIFMPSTKTLAAMLILPAITSDKTLETVTPEAKELYSLAKDTLRNLGEKK